MVAIKNVLSSRLGYLLLALLLVSETTYSQTPAGHVFSDQSFWYTPIPSNAPLHNNSTAFVKDFLRQEAAYYNNVTINTSSYASPVYYADNSVPNTKVVLVDCQHRGYVDGSLAQQWSSVPVPEYAIPAKGGDMEMTIFQASTDTLWEFWQTKKNSDGTWQACWGGRMANASANEGVFNTYYGTTATSLPFIGGQITAEELTLGQINHVMGISLVELENANIFSWPAHRSDGYNPNNEPNRIPEGLRFRLDPTVNVDALKLHPVGKIIAKAAQKYGFVVWDKAGSISLRAQNPYSYTQLGYVNPYKALFAGKAEFEVLNGFPWDRLQFLPMDYGKN